MESLHVFLALFLTGPFLVSGLSLNFGSTHCAVRKEISPCTCRHQGLGLRNTKRISVTCERMVSFQQVISALQGRFDDDVIIKLRISHSMLDDLPQMNFQQMGLPIFELRLIHNNLSALPESVFLGMSDIELISFSDNIIETMPQNVLNLMPKLKTLDISRTNVANVTAADLQNLRNLTTLILSSNNISLLEMNAIPVTVNKLHIGGNRIKHLNGTLRALSDLEWLFINNNNIETLVGELPQVLPNRRLTMMFAMHNKLTSLPEELKHFMALDVISLSCNKIRLLNGTLAHASKMSSIELYDNEIELLESSEFATLENLLELILDHNLIKTFNGSMLPLKSLKILRASGNLLDEFNPNELRGLTKLEFVDLSFNQIKEISPKIIENQVDTGPPIIVELRLEYNQLRNLSGSLGLCIHGLRRLNVSNNLIESLAPEDFLGFDFLQKLDISHNKLKSIGHAYQTLIPSLEEIIASYNFITILERELYGFPHICWADFSHNEITDISTAVADKTQCQVFGVNSTLKIYIQGNLGVCSKEVHAKAIEIARNHSMEFSGFDECPQETLSSPQEETLSSPHDTQSSPEYILL